MKYYFAWLGSKRAAKRDVPEPGCLLDRAANANLPVPAGGILLDNFYEMALQEGIIRQEENKITAVSSQELHHLLFKMARFPQLKGPVVVRPLLDNQFGQSSQPIDPAQHTSLANSLCKGWQQQNGHHELLIITTPAATLKGTAVIEPNSDTDEIKTANSQFKLPHLPRWQRLAPDMAPHAQRLQMLLRGLRRTFGDDEWEIEWWDDGRICWLWQITSPNRHLS